jgi:hypothetical protein
MAYDKIADLLGDKADSLLNHISTTVPKDMITAPSGDFVGSVFF